MLLAVRELFRCFETDTNNDAILDTISPESQNALIWAKKSSNFRPFPTPIQASNLTKATC